MTKPLAGHFAKAGVEAGTELREFRVDAEGVAELKVGAELKVDMFQAGQKVDVSGTTIGKGYAGVIKRHHFSSNRASHGNSLSHNSAGSIGMAQDPGRVFPGKRMSGHLGNVNRTDPAAGSRARRRRALAHHGQGLGARREERRRDRASEREGQGAQGAKGAK